MKTALCVFFNYPFERNIPILEELYADIFDHIVHIQPMLRSERDNVHTVYRAAFNFGGFFSDSKAFLEALDADYYVFSGDDCVLNKDLFGNAFCDTFLGGQGEIAAFIPHLLKFSNGNECTHPHKKNVLARFANGDGLSEQRIEGWQGFLPDPTPIRAAAEHLGVYSPTILRPPKAEFETLTPCHREVLNHLFGAQAEVSTPYPLVYAVSDFFIVSRKQIGTFCHNVGLLAAMNVFPEVAVPTALLSLTGPIAQAKDLDLTFSWTWGRNQNVAHFAPTSLDEVRDFIANMDKRTLFGHPIKLSKVSID